MSTRADVYLGEIAARLPGPRRWRAQILAELRDGLDQAIADQVAAGLPAEEAVTSAGSPVRHPGGHRRRVHRRADHRARPAGSRLVRGHRPAGRHLVAAPVAPTPWHNSLTGLVTAIPVVPLVAAVLAAVATTFATTGQLIRWLPEATAHQAATAMLAVAGLTVAGDLTILGVHLGSDARATPLGIIAVTASLTRIVASLVIARRAAALRRRATVPAGSPASP